MNKHPTGTIDYYRSVFMTEGLREMITEITGVMKEAGNPVTPQRLDSFIKAILYGANPDGSVRNRPPQPDFTDIKNNYSRFKFQQKVHEMWIRKRNRSV
ncbi:MULTISPECIES: hypothetical protein [Methanobacterium]|uniref:Uncharacterized protein n=1 Tax=Methanobacterium bryantii TaxID=2161 RepID=A0A2A2H8L3_METBR|nr:MULTISPECIES: hypothetical protein [Methanobacterium]OEC87860.1 hypothetical protein A9507_06710 [Methanobacterium sp. A39]PAV05727.1 hypothetical protein ASJ80_08320 [Methanobacterium bryantii]